MALLRKIMTSDVVQLAPEDTLERAIQVMDRRYVSCLVICSDRQPVGILTERDVVRVAASESRSSWLGLLLADVMSSPAIALEESEPIEAAVDLVETRRIRHVPVTDEAGDLVGIVTRSDLLHLYFSRMIPDSRSLGQLRLPASSDRRALRFALRAPVEYKVEQVTHHGTAWDISTSGMRVEHSGVPPLPGSEIVLRTSFFAGSYETELRGEVIRETETGFAIRFVDLGDRERAFLVRALPFSAWVE